jgi:ubiquinone/menaquinone biosynthesis C-methylase UbiE
MAASARSSSNIITPASWDKYIASEYEARAEPFTASFVDLMLQPFCSQQDKNDDDGTATPTKTTFDENDKDESKTLLDVGCGTGLGSLKAREKGLRVTATDVSEFMVERARERTAASTHQEQQRQHHPIECLQCDGQNLPSDWTNRFDYAMASFSVIFFPDAGKGLQEILRCLKANGNAKAVISAWGAAQETPAFQVFPDAIQEVAPHLLENSRPKRITGSPAVLQDLLEQAGFVNVTVVGPVKRWIDVPSAQAFYDRFALTYDCRGTQSRSGTCSGTCQGKKWCLY